MTTHIGKIPLYLHLCLLALLILPADSWCYYNKIHHTDEVSDVTFSPDGTLVAVASKDTNHYIYSTLSLSVVYPYTAQDKAYKARFSPDQQYIAIGLNNYTVMILDANYNYVIALSTPI